MHATHHNSADVTPHNLRRRLYFDPWRTRLVEDEHWMDLSALRDRVIAKMWCQVNDVQFFDHTITNYPPGIWRTLLRVRAAGLSELTKLRTRWNKIALPGGAGCLNLPLLTPRPKREAFQEPKRMPTRHREKVWESDDDGKTWRVC